MNFFQAIKSCYTNWGFSKLRSSRTEFWYFFLFYYGFMFLTALIIYSFQSINSSEFQAEAEFPFSGMVFIFIFAIISALPFIAVTIRRLHDVNQSGYWILAALILGGIARIQLPFLNPAGILNLIINIIILALCTQKSYEKDNIYGKSINKKSRKKSS